MQSGAAVEIALHLARTPSFMQQASATSVMTTVLPASSSVFFIASTSGAPPVWQVEAHSPQPITATVFASPTRARTSSRGFFCVIIMR